MTSIVPAPITIRTCFHLSVQESSPSLGPTNTALAIVIAAIVPVTTRYGIYTNCHFSSRLLRASRLDLYSIAMIVSKCNCECLVTEDVSRYCDSLYQIYYFYLHQILLQVY